MDGSLVWSTQHRQSGTSMPFGGRPPHHCERSEAIQSHMRRNMGPRSRGAFRPSYAENLDPQGMQRVQGRPGGRCTRGSRAKEIARARVNRRYRRRHSGLPCAVVYGLLRDLLGEPLLVCHRHQRKALGASRELGACMGAPGPHDFAVREYAVRLSAHSRPPHSAPRS